MSDQPYEVDLDMGDDPQASEVAEREMTIEPFADDVNHTFRESDSPGDWGITDEVRAERRDAVPRQRWGGDRSAEEEALSVVSEPEADTDGDPDARPGSDT
ncbi:hypothetical protein Q8791_08700 [Nocardiopsis sp. CT-R113]|uniref:Uncharacterized protein n=1 Tax=Nocardiopsis codii TaxID=3065942 RepID=A0ABU7K4X9_9ACTN|nr:hypothetical protein [Nocardiopsis sp. CT-R113]MEE2037298.1 hypothetical protein [Nocardiopsis sp. CT-R113]